MENIILNGETINLNSLPIEKLRDILDQLNAEELLIKQEINKRLENLT